MPEASQLVLGAVFAAAFAQDGGVAICVAPNGVFRSDGERWTQAAAPPGAIPARAVAFGAAPGRVYLLGRGGIYRSDDAGRTFALAWSLAGAENTALSVSAASGETLLALAGGLLWASVDGGSRWERRGAATGIDVATLDPARPQRLWAAVHGTLAVSEDLGSSWHETGQLPDRAMSVHGISASPDATELVVAADRGMFRSGDGGRTWQAEEGTLPVHLEAGPLIRDPGDPRTLYAVYSLIPYADAWRTAVEGSTLLARIDPAQIAGGVALLLLVTLAGALLVRWLARMPRALQPR